MSFWRLSRRTSCQFVRNSSTFYSIPPTMCFIGEQAHNVSDFSWSEHTSCSRIFLAPSSQYSALVVSAPWTPLNSLQPKVHRCSSCSPQFTGLVLALAAHSKAPIIAWTRGFMLSSKTLALWVRSCITKIWSPSVWLVASFTQFTFTLQIGSLSYSKCTQDTEFK